MPRIPNQGVLMLFALFLATTSLLMECKDKPCKDACQMTDTMRLMSAHTGKTGESIQIQECGNEFRVKFYVIEFSGFKGHEIITLLPVEDVSVSQSVITCDRHGKARLIMFTEKPRRKIKVLDFSFRWRNEFYTMSVSKDISPLVEPQVIETPKAKPMTKAMPLPPKLKV